METKKLRWYEDPERREIMIANLKLKHKERMEHDISMQIKKESIYWDWRKKVAKHYNAFCIDCNSISVPPCITFRQGTIRKGFDEFNIRTLQEAIDCEDLWKVDNAIVKCKQCYKKVRNPRK